MDQVWTNSPPGKYLAGGQPPSCPAQGFLQPQQQMVDESHEQALLGAKGPQQQRCAFIWYQWAAVSGFSEEIASSCFPAHLTGPSKDTCSCVTADHFAAAAKA